MPNQRIIKWSINIALILIAYLSISYSWNNHPRGGSIPGLNGLIIFVHTLPLLIVWLLQIVAFNRALHKKWSSFIFLAIGVAINLWVSLEVVVSENIKNLELESDILFGLALLTFIAYFFNDQIGIRKYLEQNEVSTTKTPFSQKLFTSAFIIWSCHLAYNFTSAFRNIDHVQFIVLDIIYILLFLLSVFYIYRKKIAAYYVLALVLSFSLYNEVAFLFRHGFFLMVVIPFLINGYFLFASILDFNRVRKDKNRTPEYNDKTLEPKT